MTQLYCVINTRTRSRHTMAAAEPPDKKLKLSVAPQRVVHASGSWYAKEKAESLIDLIEADGHKVPCHWHTAEHAAKPMNEQFRDICAAIDSSDVCFFSLDGMVVDGVERSTAATYIQMGYALGARKFIVVFDPLKKTRDTKYHWPPAFGNLTGHILQSFPQCALWTDNRAEAFAAIKTSTFTLEKPVVKPGVGQVTGSWFAIDKCQSLIEHFEKDEGITVSCDWTQRAHLDKTQPEQLAAILNAIWECQAFYMSLDGMVGADGNERRTAASYIQYGVALGAKKPVVIYDPFKLKRPKPKTCRPGIPPPFDNIMGESLLDNPSVVWTTDKIESVAAFKKFLEVKT